MATSELRDLYDLDVYAWALKNAALLRQRRFDEVDIEHVAEEIESVGKSERRELENRLMVLLAHLLKWRYKPERRSKSWQSTIREQRRQLARVLSENPSLQPQLDQILAEAYRSARAFAAYETGVDALLAIDYCPFTREDVLDPEFWPE